MTNPLLNSKAYPLLIEEIRKVIKEGETLFAFAKDSVSEDKIRKLGQDFHRLKGGAGFFGLGELYELAASMESLLIKTPGDIHEKIDKARELMAGIKKAAGSMPEPEA